MPCVHQFGIIDNFDKQKIYKDFEPEKYGCVTVSDDIVSLWCYHTETMLCYTGDTTKISRGLAMCGVTIIPPESLTKFVQIVETKTPRLHAAEVDELIKAIDKAIRQDKYMIHFGV